MGVTMNVARLFRPARAMGAASRRLFIALSGDLQ